MSIKDLFGKRSNQILTVEEYKATVERNAESVEQVEERTVDKTRFVPRASVDFDDPKTFARYGSAEKYYVDAINSVLNTYPYDGSLSEKTVWHNGATYVDNYIFENSYPRTTGYVQFNISDEEHTVTGYSNLGGVDYRVVSDPQFIYIKGGPNKTPINPTGELKREYPEGLGRSNIWHPDLQRESNLYCDGSLGNTVEFWFKLDEDRESVVGNLCLFDLWNNHMEGTDQHARFMIELPEDGDSSLPLAKVTYVSGSAGVESLEIGERSLIPAGFDFSNWNHFAFSVANYDEKVRARIYLNGELVEEKEAGTSVGSFIGETNHLSATLGAMHYDTMYGTGVARASYDEFRFWKRQQDSEKIGRNWIAQVHGGNNSDDSNIDLGVYYKFNEGIYNREKITGFDRQVLDYSGRISNGAIVNYSHSVRDLGSAIDEKSGVKNTEFRDPIIYRNHPEVQALLSDKRLEGSTHDMQNNAAIYNTMPEWITTADDESAGHNLLDLTQVISSYFDTLHLQIEALPSITNTHYVQDGEKPLPFAKHLLESVGFVAPEIFVDTTILEALSDRNEERVFEEKLHNVKNLIYQNIYNNIVGIYKAKGTEKSFRNLLRCFGVGDELIKINLYGDGVTHKLKDSYRSVSVKKNYLDFNDPDRHDSTVYQQTQPGNLESTSYISGDTDGKLDYIPFTLEASVIFPKQYEIDHPNYYELGFGYTDEDPSVMFGMHQAKADSADLTWVDTPDFGFRVTAIKQEKLSRDAKFRLDVRGFGIAPNTDDDYHAGLLETDYFYDVYDNARWNFAVRIAMDKTPDLVHNSENNVSYSLEFYGVSTILDQVEEEFLLSYPLTPEAAKAAMNANKRLFLGAEYVDTNDNEDGTVARSDVKLGEVRFWQDYIDSETIKYHSQDPDNYGVMDPYKPAYFHQNSVEHRVPQMDTLCLYWDFATVTGASVSDGIDGVDNILSDSFFYVDDVSKGTTDESSVDGRYGWLGGITKKQHTGKGDYYYPEDKKVVDRNFLFAAKQNLPEIIGATDTVQLLTQDDDYFVKNSRPVNYFWAVEKSMYQAISQEVLEAFNGIVSFNNLIGEPVNRYRMEYKNLNKLRQLFFQKFEEAPKVERYIKFYKWIDASISEMIKELIPASANFSDDMRTLIESHVLERNKYWTKYPSLEMKQTPPEAPLFGINEMLYNWRNGHASLSEKDNCLWWNARAERDDLLSSGNDDVDESKAQILDVATTTNSGPHIKKKLNREHPGGPISYDGSTFALRSLTTPYRFNVEPMKDIHGGVNNKKSKKLDYVRSELSYGSENNLAVQATVQPAAFDCDDDLVVKHPLLNRRLNVESEGANGSVFSLYELEEDLTTGQTYWSSNHSDSYGEDKDTPMQGVFTQAHVGGLQSRHVPLNKGYDEQDTRPEAWNFSVLSDTEGQYTPVEDPYPRAQYYRDEKAKRPVNIRNIKSSYGNYRIDYEVVQTSGRDSNNRWLAEQEGFDAESVFSTSSPHILGMYDFRLPERKRQEHIFTERFSAPGGPDTLSRGMLDVEAEEYALYNSLNFRNLDVRLHLQQWLTYHTERWGYRSYYRGQPVEVCDSPGDLGVFCEANFHKSHRNTAYRPEPYDFIEFDGSIVDVTEKEIDPCCDCNDDEYVERITSNYRCKTTHDNFWVTHQLPRSGHQYAWIKASTQTDIFEEVDGEVKRYSVCPWGYATNYPNVTAYHPEIETNPMATIDGQSTYAKVVVEKDRYLVDPDSSVLLERERVRNEHGFPFLNKFISYESRQHPRSYEQVMVESEDFCSEVSPIETLSGMDITVDSTWEALASGAISLNQILLHRDGPYQHPTWKQIRNEEKPAVKSQRKNNIFSTLELPRVIETITDDNKRIIFRESRASESKRYVEPVVSWNKPMMTKLSFYGSPSAGTVVHSYSNNLEIFANPYLDRRLGLKKTARQVYDVLAEKYNDLNNQFAPKLYELVYMENIFPKHRNVSLDKVRGRKGYQESPGRAGYDARSSIIRTFWAAEKERQRTKWGDGDTGLNALGYETRRSSVWALEYINSIGTGSGENVAIRGDLAWAGEAQYQGYVRDLLPGEDMLDLTTSEHEDNAWIAPRARLQFIHNPKSTKAPERAWAWKAAEISGNTPWYDSYDEFSKDVRLIGQNYSISPEFNISSHMEFYINDNAGNFKAVNKDILEMPGAHSSLSSSASRSSTSRRYFSWNGVTSIASYPLVHPNFAEGYKDKFPARVSNGDGQLEGLPDGVERIEILSPVELPRPLDQNETDWSCAEPYPVFSDVEGECETYFKIDFTDSGSEDGLPVGSEDKIDWDAYSLEDGCTSDGGNTCRKILNRWTNSFLVSSWVKLDSSISGILQLRAGPLAETKEDLFGTLPSGKLLNISKAKRELLELKSERETVFQQIQKVRRVDSLSRASRSALDKRIESLELELSKIKSKQGEIKDKLKRVAAVAATASSASSYRGALYCDGENLCWGDTHGNKIAFDVDIASMQGKWMNISLYYIGGSNTEKLTYTDNHRVILFVNGEYKKGVFDDAARQYFSIPYEDPKLENGCLFKTKGGQSPDTFSEMRFGGFEPMGVNLNSTPWLEPLNKGMHLRGRATDLTVYRGNPGITELSRDNEQRYSVKHDVPKDNAWFMDSRNKLEECYSILAEIIHDQQCENANDIYTDWRDTMDVCKLSKIAEDVLETLYYYPPLILASDYNFTPIQLFDNIGADSAAITRWNSKISESTPDAAGVSPMFDPSVTLGVSDLSSGMSYRDTIPSTVVDIGPQLNDAVPELNPGLIDPPFTQPIPNIPDFQIDPEPDDVETPEEPVEDAEETVEDEFPEPIIPSNRESRCAELVGWWRLGVPRYERETCENYVWREDFFKCYAHTDKISHIEKVREDHKSLNSEGTSMRMRLEVDAVKKLLPYNGFYPSQRAVQLGGLFYDSVMPHVTGKNDKQRFDRARTEQAALQPFFAPGILFNTIKSGIAVDWAAFTAEDEKAFREVLGHVVTSLSGENTQTNPSGVLPESIVNTRIGAVLSTNIARDFTKAASLGRINTQAEQEAFIKNSYEKNLLNVSAEVSTYSMQIQNECSQKEFENYVKVKGLDPKDLTVQEEFKKAYRCPEFIPNQTSIVPPLSSSLNSALGLDGVTNTRKISRLAASAVREIERLPPTVTPRLPTTIPTGESTIPPVATQTPSTLYEGTYLREASTFRLPFESLVSLNSYLPQQNSTEESKVFFLAPSYYETDDKVNNEYPYFEWTGNQNPLYEMAMNNFLAEIPNFFLKGGSMTTFTSLPENSFKTVKKGWTYYMDVHLYKTDEFDMTISPHDGELLVLEKDNSNRNFTTQGRYYGPAMKFMENQEESLPVGDPAQAAYVPPYFYGRAKARLKFTAQSDGQPSLEDITNNLEIDYINEEMDALFSSRSGASEITAESIFTAAIGRNPEWKNTPAYKSRMPIEACIKFDGKVYKKKTSYAARNTAHDFSADGVDRLSPLQVEDSFEKNGVWVISPRFECPTFNFNTGENLRQRYDEESPDDRCGTGMWGGYGTAPSQRLAKEQGLFISIEESFKKHEKPDQPLLCSVTNEEVQTVLLAIKKDTRYVHQNTLTLQDTYGDIYNITIGQPLGSGNAAGFDSWTMSEEDVISDVELRESLKMTDESSRYSTPYSYGACIRTVGTSKEASSAKPYAGMTGEYDIEAYLQADSWATDIFSMWSPPTSKVPKPQDIANAIYYHINYLHSEKEDFPWKAEIKWVGPENQQYDVNGPALTTFSTQRNVSVQQEFGNTSGAVVAISYDEKKIKNTNRKKKLARPLVTIKTDQDSVINPLGRLGIRYMSENSMVDYSFEETDPEIQTEREFYPRSTGQKIVNCIEAVGSLIKVCGFTPTKSRVGELSSAKEISEALVMIPFVDNPVTGRGVAETVNVFGRNFFKISDKLFNETVANVNAGKPAITKDGVYELATDIGSTSVSDMIKTAQKYNLPPKYDFMKYSDISPFVMYMFEFKEILNSDDLTNIWQGLMPNISKTAKKDLQVIEHELDEVNFFEGKKVPENIRWMVFRVKKKAKIDYWEMTADSTDDDRFKFEFEFGTNSKPDYSYNWPYDFCSLVELCRIKGGISVAPKVSMLSKNIEPIIAPEVRQKRIDDAHSQSGESTGEQATGLLQWAESQTGEDE